MLNRIFFCFAAVLTLFSSTAHGDLIFSGNFGAGTGQMEVTNDIVFNMTASTEVFAFVLDEIVIDDGDPADALAQQELSVISDGNSETVEFSLWDNLGFDAADLTANDGTIRPTSLDSVAGTELVLSAGVYTFDVALGGSFNPAYSSLVFQGNMFVADGSGNRISNIVSAQSVPEPTTTIAFLALGAMSIRRRRI